jgi:hypothetical protein
LEDDEITAVLNLDSSKHMFKGCVGTEPLLADAIKTVLYPSLTAKQPPKLVHKMKSSVDSLIDYSLAYQDPDDEEEHKEFLQARELFKGAKVSKLRPEEKVSMKALKTVMTEYLSELKVEAKTGGRALKLQSVRGMYRFVSKVLGCAGVDLHEEFKGFDDSPN